MAFRSLILLSYAAFLMLPDANAANTAAYAQQVQEVANDVQEAVQDNKESPAPNPENASVAESSGAAAPAAAPAPAAAEQTSEQNTQPIAAVPAPTAAPSKFNALLAQGKDLAGNKDVQNQVKQVATKENLDKATGLIGGLFKKKNKKGKKEEVVTPAPSPVAAAAPQAAAANNSAEMKNIVGQVATADNAKKAADMAKGAFGSFGSLFGGKKDTAVEKTVDSGAANPQPEAANTKEEKSSGGQGFLSNLTKTVQNLATPENIKKATEIAGLNQNSNVAPAQSGQLVGTNAPAQTSSPSPTPVAANLQQTSDAMNVGPVQSPSIDQGGQLVGTNAPAQTSSPSPTPVAANLQQTSGAMNVGPVQSPSIAQSGQLIGTNAPAQTSSPSPAFVAANLQQTSGAMNMAQSNVAPVQAPSPAPEGGQPSEQQLIFDHTQALAVDPEKLLYRTDAEQNAGESQNVDTTPKTLSAQETQIKISQMIKNTAEQTGNILISLGDMTNDDLKYLAVKMAERLEAVKDNSDKSISFTLDLSNGRFDADGLKAFFEILKSYLAAISGLSLSGSGFIEIMKKNASKLPGLRFFSVSGLDSSDAKDFLEFASSNAKWINQIECPDNKISDPVKDDLQKIAQNAGISVIYQ